MISEVDIRDWEKVDVKAARHELDHIYATTGFAMPEIDDFIKQVELIQRKQVKQVAALFKKSLIDE